MKRKPRKLRMTEFERGWLTGLSLIMLCQDVLGREAVMGHWVTAWITVPTALVGLALVWHTRKAKS